MVDDLILKMPGHIPEYMCNSIIETFDAEPEYMVAGAIGSDGTIDEDRKKCVERYFGWDEDGPSWILQYLKTATDEYVKRYPILNDLALWSVSPVYKIQKYLPSEGYFVLHCESAYHGDPRVLAWMIYLNTVTDDGYTEFPHQGKKFQPNAGDVLIWPAFFTHPHRGITSQSQTKYIVTGWYDYDLFSSN